MNVAELRQEYMRSGLSEADAGADPLKLFDTWLSDAVAAGLPLPNAMTLATVTPETAPDADTAAPPPAGVPLSVA